MKKATVVGLSLVLLMSVFPKSADAGSGYYYGADFGLWNFFEDAGPLKDAEGGYVFSPKAGIYFIAAGLALAIDLSITGGLIGEDKDEWFVELPTLAIQVGTGFDAFMIYAGTNFSVVGFDDIDMGGDDALAVSVLNPELVGGLQLGYEGLIVRGETHLGHVLRFGDEPNYSHLSFMFTVGYGLYSDFL